MKLKARIYHELTRRLIEPNEIIQFNFLLGELRSATILLDETSFYEILCPKLLFFTGLKDISGKEIYEGDIVTGFHINAQENVKGFVEHFEKDACFIIKFADGSYCSPSELDDIKVTGNVYTMSPRSKKRK